MTQKSRRIFPAALLFSDAVKDARHFSDFLAFSFSAFFFASSFPAFASSDLETVSSECLPGISGFAACAPSGSIARETIIKTVACERGDFGCS